MAASISDSGQLREFLANMMVGVKDGDIKRDQAQSIMKLAEKLNESFYAELKVAQINIQLKRAVAELGKLKIR